MSCDFDAKELTLGGQKVVQNPSLMCQPGTTGAVVWESALALGDYIKSHPLLLRENIR